MSKKDLSNLTPLQRHVTQENGTERPFQNEYWNFFEEGLYLDIVSGEVLFSSKHKFPASCGWPAFYQALERENIIQLEDHSLGTVRIEVRSKNADSHLGHIFNDGPAPTGMRYCINSASLRFVAFDDLEKQGLESYIDHFRPKKVEEIEEHLITLGAGCFWGVEAILSKTPGILSAVSGYSGGDLENPTYEDICTGKTGHAEVVQVKFNKKTITLSQLINLFLRLHDPTTKDRQGYDTGTQYRSAIFCHEESDIEIVTNELKKMDESDFYKDPIVTEVHLLERFYPAEEYHQDYYEKKYQGGQGPICHFVRGI